MQLTRKCHDTVLDSDADVARIKVGIRFEFPLHISSQFGIRFHSKIPASHPHGLI